MYLHPSYRKTLQTQKCGMCDNEAKVEYLSGYNSFYRNKSAGDYNFCSAECLDKFNRTKKCWFCSYGGDLVDTDDNFKVCTSNTYWEFSCSDKYGMRKNRGLPVESDPYSDDDYKKMNEGEFVVCSTCKESVKYAKYQIEFNNCQNTYCKYCFRRLITHIKESENFDSSNSSVNYRFNCDYDVQE